MSPRMTELLTDEVRDLPSSPIPVEAVIGAGRRRLWRHRAAGGTATFAAVAALALIVPSAVDGSGGGDDEPATVVTDRVAPTYSTGSTIHDGDQTIDVSPYEIVSFVQTDDGFVFVDEDHDAYFTDGGRIEQVGNGNAMGRQAADDTGSYVGWVDYGRLGPFVEYVVYDTSTRTEILRMYDEDGEPPGGGEHTSDVVDIDGDIAYLRDSRGFAAYDLSEGAHEQISWTQDPDSLWGAADGRVAHVEADGGRQYVVVSEDPGADQPRVPVEGHPVGAELSPTGRYVVTLGGHPTTSW